MFIIVAHYPEQYQGHEAVPVVTGTTQEEAEDRYHRWMAYSDTDITPCPDYADLWEVTPDGPVHVRTVI